MSKIEAKVANIVNETAMAFNSGSNKVIADGNIATVQRPDTIKDPDSHEELGTVLVPILTLRIYLVDEKYSVGSVNEFQEPPSDMPSVFLQTRARPKKIVKTKAQEKAGITVYIEVGDRVSIEVHD